MGRMGEIKSSMCACVCMTEKIRGEKKQLRGYSVRLLFCKSEMILFVGFYHKTS